jgi:hypothetical protein
MRIPRIVLLTLALGLSLAATGGLSVPNAYAACAPGQCRIPSECYGWCCVKFGACGQTAVCNGAGASCGNCLC